MQTQYVDKEVSGLKPMTTSRRAIAYAVIDAPGRRDAVVKNWSKSITTKTVTFNRAFGPQSKPDSMAVIGHRAPGQLFDKLSAGVGFL
ncbi:unnamed protein product [Allacma fusca]|uniref:Uncharacterized protein n=1 Tax=Allacma fusca TaxID=39272 RepID=A0A8J2JRR6_9HEXA|nr:unnamed protein product [Allacma fusca]